MNKEIRHDIVLMIAVFGLLLIAITAYDWASNKEGQKHQKSAETKNLFTLNHYAYSLMRILANNDRGVLEAEYNRLKNTLDAELTDTPKVADIILETLGELNSMRQDEKIRRHNVELHQKKVEKIILDQVIPAGRQGNVEPRAISKAISALIRNDFSFSKYRGSMIGQQSFSGRQIWPLEHKDVETINKLYKKVIQLHASLLGSGETSANAAFPSDGCKRLIETHKIQNPAQRHQVLVALADDYNFMPPYWYYRAISAAAAAVSNINGAYDKQYVSDFKFCLNHYEQNYKIFNNDDYYADLLMIDLLLTPYSTDEIRKQLALIMASAGNDLSTKRLFAGLILMRNGLYADAVVYLQSNIDDDQYKTISGVLMAEALAIKNDRAGLWRLLDRAMPDDTVSNQEKLYYLSKISDEVTLKKFLPQVNEIKVVINPGSFGYDTLILILPSGWSLTAPDSFDSTLTVNSQHLKTAQVGQSKDGGQVSLLFDQVMLRQSDPIDKDCLNISFKLATEHLPLNLKGKLAGLKNQEGKKAGRPTDEARVARPMEEMISEAMENIGLETAKAGEKASSASLPEDAVKPKPEGPHLVIEEISTNGSCWRLGENDSFLPCGI